VRGFVIRLAITGLAFIVTAWLVPQIHFPATQLKNGAQDILAIAGVALVFGVVNGLIGPILRLLSLPVRMATLGLFSIVINAVLLLLVAWISDRLGGAFTIGTFPPTLFSMDTLIGAVLGSVVIGLVSGVASRLLPD
jgi:putative membrane protein